MNVTLQLPGLEDALASALGGTPTTIDTVRSRPADHRVDNMTTESLHHVEADTDLGTARLFAKVLRPATKSPTMAYIPPDHHADVAANLNWLDEPRVYRSAVGRDLPDGLRLPAFHGIVQEEERLVLWLEDVPTVGDWTLARYRTAARLLASAGARWPEERLAGEGIGRRSYEYLFFGKLTNADLPVLRSPGHWTAPDLAALGGAALGSRTERLIDAAPRLLGVMGELPHALAHGDATPANLLPTADGGLVAVDWSYGCADAVGADLGQLLAGRFDVGGGEPAEVPDTADAVRDGFLDGLRQAGNDVAETDVLAGWAIAMSFRSVISATVLDHRPDLDATERTALLARRVAVADVGLTLLEDAGLI